MNESTAATVALSGVELKPCPFCGDSLAFNQTRHGDDYYKHPKNECVLAGDRFITGPFTLFDSPDDIAKWNRRAPPATA